VGNKTLLSIQPKAQYQRYEITNSNTTDKNFAELSKIGLNVSIRHYLNTGSKIKFYGEANLGIDKQNYSYNNGTTLYNYSTANFGGAIGANYFLNKTIALNGKIGFDRTEYLPNSQNSYNNVHIGLSLENFISSESEDGEGKELIAEGRESIGGNIGVNITDFGTRYQIKAQYSRFLSEGLMVGGTIEGGNEQFNRIVSKYLKIESMARYYIPLGKKLFIYPEAKIGYGDFGSPKFYYEAGIGMNYFLKKNVALEIDLLRIAGTQGQSNFFIGSNVSLKYFLK
jgi:hypothetical protein